MEDETNPNQSIKSKIEDALSKITGTGENPESEELSGPEGIQSKENTIKRAQKNSKLTIFSAFFNGLGVGLLLGLLLGLAISPVVSAIIGTMSSLLLVLLGLNENYMNAAKSIRVGSFGVFCVIGILTGIYIRSNNALAPSLSELYTEYKKIGFSEKEARDFIAYQEFDLTPSNWVKNANNETEAEVGLEGSEQAELHSPEMKQMAVGENIQAKKRNNVLYSSEVDAGQCYILESSNDKMPFAEIKTNFIVAGGTWKELANDLDPGLPESVRATTLLLLRDIFCASENSGIVKVKCENLKGINAQSSLEDIRKTLLSSGEIWSKIVGNVDRKVNSSYQKQLYLSLTKILCHD